MLSPEALDALTYSWLIPILQKDKEDLDELSNELELADEDEKVPYAYPAVMIEAFQLDY